MTGAKSGEIHSLAILAIAGWILFFALASETAKSGAIVPGYLFCLAQVRASK